MLYMNAKVGLTNNQSIGISNIYHLLVPIKYAIDDHLWCTNLFVLGKIE